MGASTFQYWRHVALPILTPTLLGTMILLFGNAFGAQATAYTLTGELNIVTLLVTRQINGDVLNNVNLGYAVAMGMVGDHGHHDPHLPLAPAPRGTVAAMRLTRLAWWIVFIIGALYFLVPLLATFIFSLGQPIGAEGVAAVVRVLRHRPDQSRSSGRASATRSSSASSRSS